MQLRVQHLQAIQSDYAVTNTLSIRSAIQPHTAISNLSCNAVLITIMMHIETVKSSLLDVIKPRLLVRKVKICRTSIEGSYFHAQLVDVPGTNTSSWEVKGLSTGAKYSFTVQSYSQKGRPYHTSPAIEVLMKGTLLLFNKCLSLQLLINTPEILGGSFIFS